MTDIARRRWIRAGVGLIATGGLMGMYTWRVEPTWLEIVERPLAIPNLPAHWRGRKVLQVSDIHVGDRVDSEYLIDSLKKIAGLKPDLVVVTGDFMTCSGAEQLDEATRVLAHLPVPKLGAFGIFGNHDYGQGWTRRDVADDLAARLGGQGIRILRNEAAEVDGLPLIGLDDLWAQKFDPAPLRHRTDGLALLHNPDGCDLPVWSKFRGAILSGHTHGGQCKPPFLPPPLLPVKNRLYTSGPFDLPGERTLYINRGLGWLHRVRFNARPELTLFSLT